MRIKQLPPAIANQIAAGEVIERPASIVKELLENSLDANADSITLEIGYGGLNQVKVSDNGDGILSDDLPLAIAAHATSKISQLQDLYSISSMGFRGEALASIASVSRLSISSKPAMQETGVLLTCQSDQFQLSPFARTQGTTIDVRDIFFNAPVRKKFLKPERYEFQAIETTIKRFALSCPEIAIKLIHNEKQVLHLPGASNEQSRLARITKLLGKPFVDQALPIDVSHAGIALKGWISGATYQRSQNDKVWVYINGRMVKDRLIHHAIKQAYEDILYPGRYPACLLYLTLSPSEVDVNVHPTKHEVRFQQPRMVHDLISSQLSAALKGAVATSYAAIPCKPSKHEVRENFPLKKPVASTINHNVDKPKKTKPWLFLYNRFAIGSLHQDTFLLDLMELGRNWLSDYLRKTSLPLACRPLLVPIHSSKPLLSEDALSLALSILSQLGIQIELNQENLLIRTLPILLPDLMIKPFLVAYFDSTTCTFERAVQLLADHQTLNGASLTETQQENYESYLNSLDSLTGKSFITILTEKTCQDLLNV